MKKIILCMFSLFFIGGCFSEDKIKEIEPENIPENAIILDVRTDAEHKDISLVQDHYFVELSELKPLDFLNANNIKDDSVYLLCRGGGRAKKAAVMFKDVGYDDVIVIKGGITKAKEVLKTK